MTNLELIKLLLELPLDWQVYRSAGEDPTANVVVRELDVRKWTRGTDPATGKPARRRGIVLR